MKNENGNFVTSTYSAYIALAMLSLGAAGRTHKEIFDALKLTSESEIDSISKTMKDLEVMFFQT